MKSVFFVMIAVALSLVGRSQPLETTVKSQALEMGKAMVAGDTKTFSRYILPELLKEGGGAAKVINMMDSAMIMFRSIGGKVSRITYGNPGRLIKFNKELQTTIPQTTVITSMIADAELSSTLIAISRDEGKNWYFLDQNLSQARELKDKLPALSPELVIPPPAKPRITPKQQQQ